jgi:O-antigen ligase
MAFRLFIILTFILIGRPQDYFSFLIPLRLALFFTFLTSFATLFNKEFSLDRIFEVKEAKYYTFFYLIMIFSIPFAYYRRLAFEVTFLTYLSNMLYFYLFVIHVNSIKKLKTILFVLSLSALSYSIFAFGSGRFSEGRLFAGTIFDPNDIAFLLISILPLSFIFITGKESFFKKKMAAASILISLCVILMTGSRGGFVGLVAVFVMIFFSKSGVLRKSHKIALVTAILIVFISYGTRIDMDRYMSITNIEDDYNVTDEFGRIAIWKTALGITLSNPITGVGVNCFPEAIGLEREDRGLAPRWQVTHNSYLQVSSELGLMGIIVFISIIMGCIKNFSYCTKMETSSAEADEMKMISELLRTGLIGTAIIAFFLSQAYSILFTVYFAFSASIRKLTISDGAGEYPDDK